MNEIRDLLNDLSETGSVVERLAELRDLRPQDEILRINAESVGKRQSDIRRKLAEMLDIRHEDVLEYKIERIDDFAYPARAVGATIVAFQELLTAIFDAIRSAPKKRYRPSADNVELSTLGFAAARSGSVVVSLTVPKERLLLVKSHMEISLEYATRLLSAQGEGDIKELVPTIGIAAITKAYSWADVSATFGLDTHVHWGPFAEALGGVSVSRSEAQSLKNIIEATSEEEYSFHSFKCTLIGFDGDTSYFHIRTEEGEDITGNLSDSFVSSGHYTTNLPYTAHVRRATRIRYATGEEKIAWTLRALEALEQTDFPS